MHFLLPELVDRIKYRQGPYFAAVGDFAAAGLADISDLNTLPAPFAQRTLGGNGYRRRVAGGAVTSAAGITSLAAVEAFATDGPWTVREARQQRHHGLVDGVVQPEAGSSQGHLRRVAVSAEAQSVVVAVGHAQAAHHGHQRDVVDVVLRAAAVRSAGTVAATGQDDADDAQAVLLCERHRCDAGVQRQHF